MLPWLFRGRIDKESPSPNSDDEQKSKCFNDSSLGSNFFFLPLAFLWRWWSFWWWAHMCFNFSLAACDGEKIFFRAIALLGPTPCFPFILFFLLLWGGNFLASSTISLRLWTFSSHNSVLTVVYLTVINSWTTILFYFSFLVLYFFLVLGSTTTMCWVLIRLRPFAFSQMPWSFSN